MRFDGDFMVSVFFNVPVQRAKSCMLGQAVCISSISFLLIGAVKICSLDMKLPLIMQRAPQPTLVLYKLSPAMRTVSTTNGSDLIYIGDDSCVEGLQNKVPQKVKTCRTVTHLMYGAIIESLSKARSIGKLWLWITDRNQGRQDLLQHAESTLPTSFNDNQILKIPMLMSTGKWATIVCGSTFSAGRTGGVPISLAMTWCDPPPHGTWMQAPIVILRIWSVFCAKYLESRNAQHLDVLC